MTATLLALALALAAVAHAEEPTPPELQAEEVGRTHVETDVIGFSVATCDRVKAVFVDPRPPEATRAERVTVTLHNRGSSLCLYKGLVLKGSLAGVYTSSARNPEGTGFFLPPGGDLSFRVKVDHPELPRVAVELQIPPGSGAIVLKGLGPDDPIPAPTAPTTP